MKVSLTDAGKRFNREWVFRHLTYTFEQGQSYAIIGPNGSGKSTFLQSIAGAIDVNEGNVRYELNGSQISQATGTIHQHVSICAPYMEVIEEMTLTEFLEFHQVFKPFLPGLDTRKIISAISLGHAANKQIRYYSSGMKQRVKLAQCIFSNSSIVLLDEPCTNLDQTGIELYHQLIGAYCTHRLVIVSSNDEVEYRFCQHRINISQYK